MAKKQDIEVNKKRITAILVVRYRGNPTVHQGNTFIFPNLKIGTRFLKRLLETLVKHESNCLGFN